MAVVKYIDSEGQKRFADEDSKAYEKHLKAQAAKPAAVSDTTQSPRLEPPKPAAKVDVKKPEPKAP